MTGGVVVGQRRNMGVAVAQAIEDGGLPLLRHSLSEYRRHASLTISNLGSAWSDVRGMNRLHHWLCGSTLWRKTIQQRVPWALAGADLGANVLEVGPGPGLTTNVLRPAVRRITAIEIDPKLAESLSWRLRGSNVEVVTGDATAMPFSDGQFSGAVSFAMLHHVPSPQRQDILLREIWRVLEPGGIFVGSDSLQSWFMRLIHIGDTLVPVDPDTVGVRLEAAGFEVLQVEKNTHAFRFQAQKPAIHL